MVCLSTNFKQSTSGNTSFAPANAPYFQDLLDFFFILICNPLYPDRQQKQGEPDSHGHKAYQIKRIHHNTVPIQIRKENNVINNPNAYE